MSEREKELYLPIEKMFNRNGYFSISARKKLPSERVHSSFGVDVHGITKQVDVAAFKWKDDLEIEAKAVECKLGRTWEGVGEAIGQATAYQRLFPEVYVASEADEDELRHVDSLLRQLGLGYIRVDKNKAEVIFPPGQNIRYNQREFELQVKAKAAILLAYHDVFGKNFQFGRASRPYCIWASTLGVCNVVLSVNEGVFWHALNLEKKKAVERIFRKIKAEELYRLISKLPTEYVLWLGKFGTYRPKKYSEEEEKSISQLRKPDLARIIDKVRGWGWEAHLQIGKEKVFKTISKSKLIEEIKRTMTDLTPLQKYFS